MDELANNIRKLVIDTLKLLSSKEEQLKYQKNVPIADVSAELFCQWDGAYVPESPVNNRAFSKEEIVSLDEFNTIFNKIADSTPDNLPSIEKFVETNEWKELSISARKTLDSFKND